MYMISKIDQYKSGLLETIQDRCVDSKEEQNAVNMIINTILL